MFRKALFWTHLSCGVVAGLVVLMMSVTGVLLTYERQILSWADFRAYKPPVEVREKLPVATLVAAARDYDPGFEPSSIEFYSDPDKPMVLSAGRSGQLVVDPYSGEVFGSGAEGLHDFFGAVTGWHRWFNTSGENREIARAITGASNLMFLFLILSGIYLWLPRFWNWANFRGRLLFRTGPMTGKARDFNWHHVFGIWSAIPLAVVVATASVFYYDWANSLVYRAFGEEPPTRGGGSTHMVAPAESGSFMAPEALLERASRHLESWQRIGLALPLEGPNAEFEIDMGNGGQPQLQHSLQLDRKTGAVAHWQPFQSQSPGRQARSWVRRLHTGEAFGIMGQSIAGLVSFTSILLVWTGLALAYRRLIVPLLKKPGT